MGDDAYKLSTYAISNDTYDVRYYPTTIEVKKVQETWGLKFPHVRPNSVYVGSIGTKWSPGAWQKVMDMVEYTNKMGVCCWFNEIPEINATIPYSSVNKMRDIGCMHAHDMGFEWFLMIENDALPEQDLVLRLLKWDLPVVVPYIMDELSKTSIGWPHHERNVGIKPINWSVFTCILIWTKVLNCFDCCRPFQDTFIESDFFNKLIHYGHKAYQDTNTELKIATRPTYHGTMKTLHELWRFWEDTFDRMAKPSDRKPINPEDKREVYLA